MRLCTKLGVVLLVLVISSCAPLARSVSCESGCNGPSAEAGNPGTIDVCEDGWGKPSKGLQCRITHAQYACLVENGENIIRFTVTFEYRCVQDEVIMNYTGVVVSLGTKNGDSLSELCSHEEWTLATPNGLHWPKPPPGILLGEERTPRGSSREGPKLLLYLVYGEICRIDITADYKRGEIDALSDSGPVEIIAEMRSCSFFPSDVFWDSIILSPPYEMVAAE